MPYVRHVCVLLPLVRSHERHEYMLLPLVILYIRHARLVLHIGVRLKGKTTRIWSFSCGFACTTTMGCAGFKLSFGIIIVLYLLTIIA